MMPRTKSQAYAVLGLSPDATDDQVKKLWRALSREFDLIRKDHSDTIPPPPYTTGMTVKGVRLDEKATKEYIAKYKALRQEATERMKEMKAAWDLLKR